MVNYLTSTLSETILSLTVGITSSQAICHLHAHFSQASVANATNICFQLLALTKGSRSISNYLYQAKSIAESLAAIN